MASATITVQVDDTAARAYQAASVEERQKLDLLISLWLREVRLPLASLQTVMDEISDKAQARGLTDEVLESLLNDL